MTTIQKPHLVSPSRIGRGGRVFLAFLALVLAGLFQPASADALQELNLVDVTLNLSEDGRWHNTTFYANPPTNSKVGCADDKLSFFFSFDYKYFDGKIIIRNMRLTNGASRKDPIQAVNWLSRLDGDNIYTTTPMVRPGSRGYVYSTAYFASGNRESLSGPHPGRFIHFDIISAGHAHLCGAIVYVYLK